MKIPVEILAYLITKRDVKPYFLCNEYESFFSGSFLSINCLFENTFSVPEQQKHFLHVSEAYLVFRGSVAALPVRAEIKRLSLTFHRIVNL